MIRACTLLFEKIIPYTSDTCVVKTWNFHHKLQTHSATDAVHVRCQRLDPSRLVLNDASRQLFCRKRFGGLDAQECELCNMKLGANI